ncbi:hypothetical protein BURK2_00759 [Burkholderiales bacterium]|jgi:hypothetical protein|nr:MAG: hypothetical protein F9K47_04230 [Burkholderiales bacterium]CAG0961453.1 hypothetical protein BURK2_00759 [Burkholderiales bacterium]
MFYRSASRLPTSRTRLSGVALIVAAFFCASCGASSALAQGSSVAEIQAREARNADARTLAALERFRKALIARYGADPKLTMLEFGESEAAALVMQSGGASEFVIWQENRWSSTANRKLEPWASPSVAAANGFALSVVKPSSIRGWLDAWRGVSGQASDFVMKYEFGFDPAAVKVVGKARVGSLATGRMAYVAFDAASGQELTIAKAAAAPTPKPAAKQSDDLRRDFALALAALRREVPATRLGAVRIERREIEITLADRSTWRFDASHTLKSGARYEGSFLCEQGFTESEVDWSKLGELPRNGVLAAGLSNEDEHHARFVVDRPRDCGDLAIEVIYANYKTPQPWVRFDPRGRFLRSSQ